jgi:dihydrofolate synthase/folylpolyglutamate synthase
MINNFVEVNQVLEHFYNNGQTRYNLDNMQALMDYLDNPQEKMKVIHIAGTSGKTSTSYYMAQLLSASGKKTGLTISPHINKINERVQINCQPVEEATFCKTLEEFLGLIKESGSRLSRFELLIAFAYWYFANQEVDYAVIEVGLGGLKDGTNVVNRSDKVCLITDIGFDHMKVLGNTLAEIAAQKAGIIQPRNVVFAYNQSAEIDQVIANASSAQKAELHFIKPVKNEVAGIPDYQFRNWNLAYASYKLLKKRDGLASLDSQAIQKTQAIVVPGRMDVRRVGSKTLILDGAHNEQKISAMISSFIKLYPNQKPAVLISIKQDKDYRQVVELIAGLASRVIVTGFELSQDVPVKSMSGQKLVEAFNVIDFSEVTLEKDQSKAIDILLNGQEGICMVTGSLYLIGQLKNKELV